jgi:hypothetical protein
MNIAASTAQAANKIRGLHRSSAGKNFSRVGRAEKAFGATPGNLRTTSL